MKIIRISLLAFCIQVSASAQSIQDSLIVTHLDFEQAKAILLKQNLSLIAAYYDVSAAEGELIQAKLWNNPNFVWNQDLYSIEQNRYFRSKNQHLIQVEQIFSIAGKHTNTVRLAKTGVELSRLQMEDVMRSLLFELGEVYQLLHTAQQKQQLYVQTLNRYDQLIKSSQEKLKVGAMAPNEVLRLRSEQLMIRAEATANNNEVLEYLSQLRILLNANDKVYFQTTDNAPQSLVLQPLYLLIDEALNSRADYRLQEMQRVYSERNLKLQRSLAVPDLNFAYQPNDKGSNYVRSYQGVNLEFNVPIFNRNQGNIKIAKARIEQSNVNAILAESKVRNEVQKSYEQLINTKKGYEDFSDEFLRQTEELNTNANNNYNKRNINLLEFIDLQRIYIQNKTQYIELKNAYQRSVNQLNFSVGKEVIK